MVLIQTGIWIAGIGVAGVLMLDHARTAVRTESASNLELVQHMLGPVLADGSATASKKVFDEIVEGASRVRHVRVVTARSLGNSPTARAIRVDGVPGWFAGLVAPPPEALPRIVLPSSVEPRTLIIEADPSDEIREAWEEVRTFLSIACWVFVLVCAMLYLVLRHSLGPLAQLLAAFEHLERDDFSTRVSEKAVPELARIHREFNRMAEVLGTAVQRNRWLAAHLVNLQEEERRRLARELHDDMGPYLFDITVRTHAIRNITADRRFSEISPQLLAIDATVAELQGRVRDILRRLRPLALDELGLKQALADMVETWQARHPQTRWSLTAHGLDGELDDSLRVTVYRIAQECLTNIGRHAKARNAWATVSVGASPSASHPEGHFEVSIEDDGKGIAAGVRFGLGLTGLSERIHALGGRLTVTPRERGGTRVHAWLPLTLDPRADED